MAHIFVFRNEFFCIKSSIYDLNIYHVSIYKYLVQLFGLPTAEMIEIYDQSSIDYLDGFELYFLRLPNFRMGTVAVPLLLLVGHKCH